MDDVLVCSHDPKLIMDNLALIYDLKEGSVGKPTIYLGAKIKKYQVNSGVVPAPDGTIYLVDINETHYWGSFCGTCIGVKNTFLEN